MEQEPITTHRVVSRMMIEFVKAWDRTNVDNNTLENIIATEKGNLVDDNWDFKENDMIEIIAQGSKNNEKHYARIYVSSDDDKSNAVVSFRGSRTSGERDWWRNLHRKRKKDGNMEWHEGFLYMFKLFRNNNLWSELKCRTNINTRVWFTGHSMGGAIATIASFYFNKGEMFKDYVFGGMIAFGAPKSVSDRDDNKYPIIYNDMVPKKRCCNHVNGKDPVPKLFKTKYSHVGRINFWKLTDDNLPYGKWYDGIYWKPEGSKNDEGHDKSFYEKDMEYWWKVRWFDPSNNYIK